MARILYSGIVSEIRGSIAGTTFQQNASGKVVKARSNQQFSSSSLQSSCQNKLSAIVMKWRSLTVTQRTDWQGMAEAYPRTDKWGRVKTLSGFQYYAAANRNLVTAGLSKIDSPNSYVAPMPVPDYDPSVASDSFFLQFTESLNLTNHTLLVFASPPTQRLSSTSRVLRRLISTGTGGYSEGVEILTPYLAVYPLNWSDLITNGHCVIKLFLCTVANSTGLTSQFNAWQVEIN